MSNGKSGNLHSYGRDQVVKIINSVIAKVEKTGDLSREGIFHEMQDLMRIIEDARQDISKARAADISQKHIPTATDELDAIVQATAAATGQIMDACEVIEQKATEAGAQGELIAAEVTKIYEACSFQDITGQRITKVVSTLKAIEDKVAKLIHILGDKLPGAPAEEESATPTGDAALLNGPQLPDKAISQDDIDRLLAEIDGKS